MQEKCNECGTYIKKPHYAINVVFRNPEKKYTISGKTFMQTENTKFCKKHFIEKKAKLEKLLRIKK